MTTANDKPPPAGLFLCGFSAVRSGHASPLLPNQKSEHAPKKSRKNFGGRA